MSLRRRLFITVCIVVLIGFFSITKWIRDELNNSYSQVVEEILVDYAHLISAYIENNRMSAQSFESLKEMFNKSKTHNINAKIFDFIKTNPSLEMYVTDNKGLVLFSTKEEEIGRNFVSDP